MKFSWKSQNLAGRPILHTFWPSQKHQNLHQSKIHRQRDQRSRTRGVAKIDFSIPALHGNHLFFWSAPCVGTRFSQLMTPPQREGDFFHFFNTSPARSKKNNEIAFGSPILDDPPWKTRKANRHQNVTLLPRLRTGRVFEIDKIASNRNKIVRIPQGL